MRICVYTHTALPVLGGQQLVVDALVREFQHAGHETVVLSPYDEQQKQAGSFDRNLPYKVVRHPDFFSTRFFVSWYARYLERLYRCWPFDLLHCHNVYPCAYLAAPICQRLGIPLVITSHGGDVRRDNPRFRKRGLRDRHIAAIQAADALIAISTFTESGFRDLGADSNRIHAIPNGVDFAALSPRVNRPFELDARLQPKSFFLFLGRLAPRKGVDLLLRSIALLCQQTQARSIPLTVIAGTGPEGESLQALAKELGVADKVAFVGSVHSVQKTWLLQNARATVIPSRQWEAFPLVVLEANAADCPVVATDVPGLRDLVQHERTGLLFPSEDPAALASSLRRLIDQPELAGTFQIAARRFAEDCSWPNIADRHLKLFADLTAANERRKAA